MTQHAIPTNSITVTYSGTTLAIIKEKVSTVMVAIDTDGWSSNGAIELKVDEFGGNGNNVKSPMPIILAALYNGENIRVRGWSDVKQTIRYSVCWEAK